MTCIAACQDVRKAQSLGFAFDSGIEIVEADVTKGTRYGSMTARLAENQRVPPGWHDPPALFDGAETL